MSSEITAAISGFAGLVGLFKTAVEARDWAKTIEATAKLNEQIIQSQHTTIEEQAARAVLVDQLSKAREELRQLEASLVKKSQHRAVEIRPNTFVLEVMDGMEVVQAPGVRSYGRPLRYACQLCLERAGKSILLRYNPSYDTGPASLSCPNCGDTIHLDRNLYE